MRVATTVAQLTWLLSGLPEAARFRGGTGRVAGAQRRLLLRILRDNACTDFGRRHRFAALRTVADYQSAVPMGGYAAFSGDIERIANGETDVLTAAPVRRLQPTSGSDGARKLIPYTAGLQAEFARGLAPWIADLFLRDPRLLAGPAYWSISPVLDDAETTPGGIPVGFEDDAAYLGKARAGLVRAALAAPSELRRLVDVESFRYATLLSLVRARDLALVSVWHPTFLALLIDGLATRAERLASDVERGTVSPPAPVSAQVVAALRSRPRPARAAEIRRLAATFGDDEPEFLGRLWPRLRLISCWTDGDAARPADDLAARFPRARVQGKGLLATEGFITLPLAGLPAPLLAFRSHFFEFLPVNGGRVRLPTELTPGAEYSVVLTTSGGLYRYRLGDRVRCVGYHHECPMLTFLGREGCVSDHVGEKLSEPFVQRAIADTCAAAGFGPRFALLAWHERGYALCLESSGTTDEQVAAVARALEDRLAANPHYAYARRLGQLAPLRVFLVEGDGHAAHLAACQARGLRLGDAKPFALWRHEGWVHSARGRWLPPEAGGRGGSGRPRTTSRAAQPETSV